MDEMGNVPTDGTPGRPEPHRIKLNSFSEMPLSAALQQQIARASFTTPTPVQAQAIPPALEGRDVLATAQTGTGKTMTRGHYAEGPGLYVEGGPADEGGNGSQPNN